GLFSSSVSNRATLHASSSSFKCRQGRKPWQAPLPEFEEPQGLPALASTTHENDGGVIGFDPRAACPPRSLRQGPLESDFRRCRPVSRSPYDRKGLIHIHVPECPFCRVVRIE